MVDTEGPTVTLVTPTNDTTNASGTVEFKYTVNDLARETMNCTVHFSGAANTTNITQIENTNQTFIMRPPQSDHMGWFVECYDNASNQGNSSVYTLKTTNNTVNPITNNPGGGGSSYNGNDYNIGTLGTSGTTKENLRNKDKIALKVKENTHTATIGTVTSNTVTLTITSTPITKIITVGESVIYDLVGTPDLKVTLNSLSSGRASFTFVEYTVPVQTTPPTEEEPDTVPEVTGDIVKESPADKTDTTWVWILGVIAIVIIVTYYMTKKKK
jgi:hypothetical protein